MRGTENLRLPDSWRLRDGFRKASVLMSVARSLSSAPDGRGEDAAVHAIVARVAAEREALARRIAERLASEAEAAALGLDRPGAIEDRYKFVLELVDAFLASLEGAESWSMEQVERTREIAARRVREHVSLELFLHSARVWGEFVWDAVVANARMGDPREREAAIRIASRIMRQVDVISRNFSNAYLDEITDRGLLRRDLLEALISGDDEASRRLARSLRLKLADSYIVLVVRGEEIHGELGREESLRGRVALDRIVDSTRRHVRPSAGVLLAGMSQGDLIVLYPVSGQRDLQLVREDSADLAKSLPVDISIGMSVCHNGPNAIAVAYAEAREAAEVAEELAIRGRAVGLEDVLVDHMLRGSAHAQRILVNTMNPLVEYDRQHGADLVATLQAYVGTRFNLTKSGELLSIHPNTVVYRLRRIHELTHRDPYDADDLLVLWLGLKVMDLRGRDVR
jgi:sugar diacid utilization regulator